jgi:hypothetical protein
VLAITAGADLDGINRASFGREFGQGFGFGSDQPAVLARRRDLILDPGADADASGRQELRRLLGLTTVAADADRAVKTLPIPVNGDILQELLWRVSRDQSVEFDTDNEQSLDLQS